MVQDRAMLTMADE